MEMIAIVTNMGMDAVRNANPGGLQLHEKLPGPLSIFLIWMMLHMDGVWDNPSNQDNKQRLELQE